MEVPLIQRPTWIINLTPAFSFSLSKKKKNFWAAFYQWTWNCVLQSSFIPKSTQTLIYAIQLWICLWLVNFLKLTLHPIPYLPEQQRIQPSTKKKTLVTHIGKDFEKARQLFGCSNWGSIGEHCRLGVVYWSHINSWELTFTCIG